VAADKPMTDEQMQRLADQAETGYDTEAPRRTGGRKPLRAWLRAA